MTEWPAVLARQPKSTSSRNSARLRSSPPSSSNTSRRISAPAVLTESTSWIPSCWPWSYSNGSSPVQRAPLPAILIPASNKCVRSCQPSNFGPTITTCGRSSTALNNSASAVGAGAQSSWINQIHSCSIAFGNLSTASETACPKPVSRSVEKKGMRADFNNFVEVSSDPVSTAVIKSIGRV